ncbi:hypothetical protein CT0861_04073, partial [Colletotrichum tofieldiae]
ATRRHCPRFFSVTSSRSLLPHSFSSHPSPAARRPSITVNKSSTTNKMTEPENFEEDLFADLYDDDTPAKPAATQDPAPAPAPAPASVPQQSIETHVEPPAQPEPDYGGGDDQMKYEEDDDDDDVDFNLGGDSAGGGGGGGSGSNYAPPSNGVGNMKHEEPTYSTSTAKNPSAKEDG